MLDALLRARPGEEQVDPADALVAMVGRPSWHRYAGCRGVGAEVFFPGRGATLNLARHLCSSCSVAGECLADALSLDERDDDGFRAGTSANKRRGLRRSTEAA